MLGLAGKEPDAQHRQQRGSGTGIAPLGPAADGTPAAHLPAPPLADHARRMQRPLPLQGINTKRTDGRTPLPPPIVTKELFGGSFIERR